MHAPFDFENEETRNLIDKKIKEYPQLLPALSPSSDPEIMNLIRQHRLQVKPGVPQTNENSNWFPSFHGEIEPIIIKKVDWEAWLVYYELCRISGFYVDYEIIGELTGRTKGTVKNKLSEIREIYK
jgi:hypothetical protein